MEIDVTQHLGTTDRQVRSGHRDGQPITAVVARRRYDTSIDDLWNALTDAERIPRWFLPISGDLRLGGRYQLEGNAGGEITSCDPPRSFAVTWEYGDEVTWVEVRLAPAPDGGTQLELEHAAPTGGEHWDRYGPGAVGIGWDEALVGLGLHLDTGAAVDAAEVMAWQATPDGKAFVRACSDDWCRADVAAGADPTAAAAAAERTRAAYTGETEAEDEGAS